MKTKLLITGSCGFIFSNFIRKAIYDKSQYDLISIDRVSKSSLLNNIFVNKSHTFYLADICDEHIINRIFEYEKPEIVLHGAACSFVDDSLKNPNDFIRSNVLGTQIIVNACVKWGVKKLVYTSTDEVMGSLKSPNDPPWTEEAALDPKNPYCLASDTLVLTDSGQWKEIKTIVKNNNIIGFDFQQNKPKLSTVEESLFKNGEKLLEIKTEFGTLKCSPEHTLFIRRYKRLESGKLDAKHAKKNNTIQEIKSKDLVVGDFLAMQRQDPEPTNSTKINPMLCRFLGYFLGDGNCGRNTKNKNTMYIKLADESKERLERYCDIIKIITKELYGREARPSFYKHSTKNCWYLSFGCQPLIELIEKLKLNNKSKDKVISPEIFNWSNDAIYEFLAGYFDADGNITNCQGLTASFSSSSLKLLNNIKLLLRRAGVLAHESNEYNIIKWGKERVYWKLNISDSKSMMMFKKYIKSDKNIYEVLAKPQRMLDDNNLVVVRVQEILVKQTDDILYDICAPETKNFIANGFIVHNSASKASGELIIKAANNSFELPYVITRASNNYGPRQSEKLIPVIIKSIMNNQKIPVYGNGSFLREWTYVDDNCAALLAVLGSDKINTIYNISSNQEYSNIEVVQEVCNSMGGGHNLIEHITDPRGNGHDFRYSVNCDKIKSELNWKPEVKFKDGIAKTVQWYKNNPYFAK